MKDKGRYNLYICMADDVLSNISKLVSAIATIKFQAKLFFQVLWECGKFPNRRPIQFRCRAASSSGTDIETKTNNQITIMISKDEPLSVKTKDLTCCLDLT